MDEVKASSQAITSSKRARVKPSGERKKRKKIQQKRQSLTRTQVQRADPPFWARLRPALINNIQLTVYSTIFSENNYKKKRADVAARISPVLCVRCTSRTDIQSWNQKKRNTYILRNGKYRLM